jgi:hypothetical protein
METTASAPPPLPLPDRSTGLLVFGVLTILLGALAGLMTLMMALGSVMAARGHVAGAEMSPGAVLPALLVYGGLTVALVWLGIGSIKARRWARALLLILAWSGLAVGVPTLVAMALVVPKVITASAAQMPEGPNQVSSEQMGTVITIVSLGVGLMFLAVPVAGILFYGRRDVRATCERRDPVPRWTDACPLPLLAVSLWLAAAVPSVALLPLSNHGVVPLFGGFVRGAASAGLCLLLTALLAWMAWRLYRRDARAWWALLALMALGCASNLLTFVRHGGADLYRQMGYPEEQVEQIAATGVLDGSLMLWLSAGTIIPLFGYLLWVKRHLRPQPRA